MMALTMLFKGSTGETSGKGKALGSGYLEKTYLPLAAL